MQGSNIRDVSIVGRPVIQRMEIPPVLDVHFGRSLFNQASSLIKTKSEDAPHQLILDFSNNKEIDIAGLGFILLVLERFEKDVKIVAEGASGVTRKLLKPLGILSEPPSRFSFGLIMP